MKLRDLLYKVTLLETSGDMSQEVKGICFDSRKVDEGSLFIAVKGTQVDGHDYVDQAIAKGATAIVAENALENIAEGIAVIRVKNSAESLGLIAANFYQHPSAKLKLVAVTGTNGKTTIVTLLFNLFKLLGHDVGLLSTIQNQIKDKVLKASHTTGDAIQINSLLAEMVNAGVTHCFMEASSHAIDQHRTAGLKFEGAIFTNITHDHLDYHGTFDHYIAAKKKLFDDLDSDAFALFNADDRRGKVMAQNCNAQKAFFSLKAITDFRAKIISNTMEGLEMDFDRQQVWFSLLGNYNAYNLLTAYAAGSLMGIEKEELLKALSQMQPIPGRFELVRSKSKTIAIVDYAHTPDALENVLKAINGLRNGNEQVITVVGCGGDRDKSKRPLMAHIAAVMSDKVIITSDNPRTEDPEEILRDMEAGFKISQMRKVLKITNRKEAIKTACSLAGAKDIILVAGKGHETYQEIKGERFPFDDREVLKEMFHMLNQG